MKVRKKKLQLLLLANVKKNGKMKEKLQIKVFGEFDSSKDNLINKENEKIKSKQRTKT